MTESEWAEWQAEAAAARRDAHALALNVLTGDCEASLALLLPRTTDEKIAIVSALAGDLAIALQRIHGGPEPAIEHLRSLLLALARETA